MSSSVYILRCSPARPKVSACTRPRRRRIGVQHLKQRLRLCELGGEALHLLVRGEQERMALEELAFVQRLHGLEERRLVLQPLQEGGIGLGRQLGGGGLDHHQNGLIAVGKRLVDGKFSLAPIEVLRD